MIQHGADVNAKTSDQRTALHYVCEYYQNDNLIEAIRLLIQHKADVNAKDTFELGYNALQVIHSRENRYKKEIEKLLS